jgi:hypothetical protein
MTFLAAGLTIWDLRQEAMKTYSKEIENLGVAFAEQTSRTLQAVDLVLDRVKDRVLGSAIETPAQFEQLLAGRKWRQFLADRLKNLPFPTGEQLFELRGCFDSGAEYPVLDPVQHEVDRLQGARGLLAEGDPEIFDFLRIGFHRLLAQIPNCQTGGKEGHANDRKTDQVEASVGWGMLPQAREKLHYESSL